METTEHKLVWGAWSLGADFSWWQITMGVSISPDGFDFSIALGPFWFARIT